MTWILLDWREVNYFGLQNYVGAVIESQVGELTISRYSVKLLGAQELTDEITLNGNENLTAHKSTNTKRASIS